MANNLFVSYDLHAPNKNYEAVTKAIKELGDWAKVHYSYFYVKSQLHRFTGVGSRLEVDGQG